MSTNQNTFSDGSVPIALRAAQYVRMSTDHQQYSTENQSDKIREYAAKHGLEIVRTYADEGKSGLRIDGRKALQQLLQDVESGNVDFGTILVYDVSRWGRFQDTDEGAYYEYVCRHAGIKVAYCAELFDNDGSVGSDIIKNVKRAMSGEYSRELSGKVFAGQCRLIELGFRQGGPAGYGLRRMLVDQAREAKGELARGEHKSIQTDRVILVPGPAREIRVVNQMFRWLIEAGLVESEIAAKLNALDVRTDLDRAWTRGTVHEVLTNEKYIGNNVYNRHSFKLKKAHVSNPPEMWIRKAAAFESIVPPEVFAAAQEIIQARARRFSNDELLEQLRALYQHRGFLSGLIINETDGMSSSSVYAQRFGSLVRAYQAVGFLPDRDYRYIEINRYLRQMHPQVVAEAQGRIAELGTDVVRDKATDLLTVDGEFTLSLVLARCHVPVVGQYRWKVRFDASLFPDITVVVRLDHDNRAALDYYVLPRLDFFAGKLNLAEKNAIELDGYRFDTLDYLYSLTARVAFRRAA